MSNVMAIQEVICPCSVPLRKCNQVELGSKRQLLHTRCMPKCRNSTNTNEKRLHSETRRCSLFESFKPKISEARKKTTESYNKQQSLTCRAKSLISPSKEDINVLEKVKAKALKKSSNKSSTQGNRADIKSPPRSHILKINKLSDKKQLLNGKNSREKTQILDKIKHNEPAKNLILRPGKHLIECPVKDTSELLENVILVNESQDIKLSIKKTQILDNMNPREQQGIDLQPNLKSPSRHFRLRSRLKSPESSSEKSEMYETEVAVKKSQYAKNVVKSSVGSVSDSAVMKNGGGGLSKEDIVLPAGGCLTNSSKLGKKGYFCHECGKILRNRSEYNRHMRSCRIFTSRHKHDVKGSASDKLPLNTKASMNQNTSSKVENVKGDKESTCPRKETGSADMRVSTLSCTQIDVSRSKMGDIVTSDNIGRTISIEGKCTSNGNTKNDGAKVKMNKQNTARKDEQKFARNSKGIITKVEEKDTQQKDGQKSVKVVVTCFRGFNETETDKAGDTDREKPEDTSNHCQVSHLENFAESFNSRKRKMEVSTNTIETRTTHNYSNTEVTNRPKFNNNVSNGDHIDVNTRHSDLDAFQILGDINSKNNSNPSTNVVDSIATTGNCDKHSYSSDAKPSVIIKKCHQNRNTTFSEIGVNNNAMMEPVTKNNHHNMNTTDTKPNSAISNDIILYDSVHSVTNVNTENNSQQNARISTNKSQVETVYNKELEFLNKMDEDLSISVSVKPVNPMEIVAALDDVVSNDSVTTNTLNYSTDGNNNFLKITEQPMLKTDDYVTFSNETKETLRLVGTTAEADARLSGRRDRMGEILRCLDLPLNGKNPEFLHINESLQNANKGHKEKNVRKNDRSKRGGRKGWNRYNKVGGNRDLISQTGRIDERSNKEDILSIKGVNNVACSQNVDMSTTEVQPIGSDFMRSMPCQNIKSGYALDNSEKHKNNIVLGIREEYQKRCKTLENNREGTLLNGSNADMSDVSGQNTMNLCSFNAKDMIVPSDLILNQNEDCLKQSKIVIPKYDLPHNINVQLKNQILAQTYAENDITFDLSQYEAASGTQNKHAIPNQTGIQYLNIAQKEAINQGEAATQNEAFIPNEAVIHNEGVIHNEAVPKSPDIAQCNAIDMTLKKTDGFTVGLNDVNIESIMCLKTGNSVNIQKNSVDISCIKNLSNVSQNENSGICYNVYTNCMSDVKSVCVKNQSRNEDLCTNIEKGEFWKENENICEIVTNNSLTSLKDFSCDAGQAVHKSLVVLNDDRTNCDLTLNSIPGTNGVSSNDSTQDHVTNCNTSNDLDGCNTSYDLDGCNTINDLDGCNTSYDLDGCNTSNDLDGCNTSNDLDGCNTSNDFGGCNTSNDLDGCNTINDLDGCNASNELDGCNTSNDFGGCNTSNDLDGCNTSNDLDGCNTSNDLDGCNTSNDLNGCHTSNDLGGNAPFWNKGEKPNWHIFPKTHGNASKSDLSSLKNNFISAFMSHTEKVHASEIVAEIIIDIIHTVANSACAENTGFPSWSTKCAYKPSTVEVAIAARIRRSKSPNKHIIPNQDCIVNLNRNQKEAINQREAVTQREVVIQNEVGTQSEANNIPFAHSFNESIHNEKNSEGVVQTGIQHTEEYIGQLVRNMCSSNTAGDKYKFDVSNNSNHIVSEYLSGLIFQRVCDLSKTVQQGSSKQNKPYPSDEQTLLSDCQNDNCNSDLNEQKKRSNVIVEYLADIDYIATVGMDKNCNKIASLTSQNSEQFLDHSASATGDHNTSRNKGSVGDIWNENYSKLPIKPGRQKPILLPPISEIWSKKAGNDTLQIQANFFDSNQGLYKVNQTPHRYGVEKRESKSEENRDGGQKKKGQAISYKTENYGDTQSIKHASPIVPIQQLNNIQAAGICRNSSCGVAGDNMTFGTAENEMKLEPETGQSLSCDNDVTLLYELSDSELITSETVTKSTETNISEMGTTNNEKSDLIAGEIRTVKNAKTELIVCETGMDTNEKSALTISEGSISLVFTDDTFQCVDNIDMAEIVDEENLISYDDFVSDLGQEVYLGYVDDGIVGDVAHEEVVGSDAVTPGLNEDTVTGPYNLTEGNATCESNVNENVSAFDILAGKGDFKLNYKSVIDDESACIERGICDDIASKHLVNLDNYNSADIVSYNTDLNKYVLNGNILSYENDNIDRNIISTYARHETSSSEQSAKCEQKPKSYAKGKNCRNRVQKKRIRKTKRAMEKQLKRGVLEQSEDLALKKSMKRQSKTNCSDIGIPTVYKKRMLVGRLRRKKLDVKNKPTPEDINECNLEGMSRGQLKNLCNSESVMGISALDNDYANFLSQNEASIKKGNDACIIANHNLSHSLLLQSQSSCETMTFVAVKDESGRHRVIQGTNLMPSLEQRRASLGDLNPCAAVLGSDRRHHIVGGSRQLFMELCEARTGASDIRAILEKIEAMEVQNEIGAEFQAREGIFTNRDFENDMLNIRGNNREEKLGVKSIKSSNVKDVNRQGAKARNRKLCRNKAPQIKSSYKLRSCSKKDSLKQTLSESKLFRGKGLIAVRGTGRKVDRIQDNEPSVDALKNHGKTARHSISYSQESVNCQKPKRKSLPDEINRHSSSDNLTEKKQLRHPKNVKVRSPSQQNDSDVNNECADLLYELVNDVETVSALMMLGGQWVKKTAGGRTSRDIESEIFPIVKKVNTNRNIKLNGDEIVCDKKKEEMLDTRESGDMDKEICYNKEMINEISCSNEMQKTVGKRCIEINEVDIEKYIDNGRNVYNFEYNNIVNNNNNTSDNLIHNANKDLQNVHKQNENFGIGHMDCNTSKDSFDVTGKEEPNFVNKGITGFCQRVPVDEKQTEITVIDMEEEKHIKPHSDDTVETGETIKPHCDIVEIIKPHSDDIVERTETTINPHSDDSVEMLEAKKPHSDDIVERTETMTPHSDDPVEIAEMIKPHSDETVEMTETMTPHSDDPVEVAEMIIPHSDDTVEMAETINPHSDDTVKMVEMIKPHSDDTVEMTETMTPHSDDPVEVAEMINPHSDDTVEVPETINPHPDDPVEVPETINPHPDDPVEVPETINPHPDDPVEVPETINPHPDDPVEVPETIKPHSDDPVEVPETINPHSDDPVEVPETIKPHSDDPVEVPETINPHPDDPVEVPETIKPHPDDPSEMADITNQTDILHSDSSDIIQKCINPEETSHKIANDCDCDSVVSYHIPVTRSRKRASITSAQVDCIDLCSVAKISKKVNKEKKKSGWHASRQTRKEHSKSKIQSTCLKSTPKDTSIDCIGDSKSSGIVGNADNGHTDFINLPASCNLVEVVSPRKKKCSMSRNGRNNNFGAVQKSLDVCNAGLSLNSIIDLGGDDTINGNSKTCGHLDEIYHADSIRNLVDKEKCLGWKKKPRHSAEVHNRIRQKVCTSSKAVTKYDTVFNVTGLEEEAESPELRKNVSKKNSSNEKKFEGRESNVNSSLCNGNNTVGTEASDEVEIIGFEPPTKCLAVYQPSPYYTSDNEDYHNSSVEFVAASFDERKQQTEANNSNIIQYLSENKSSQHQSLPQEKDKTVDDMQSSDYGMISNNCINYGSSLTVLRSLASGGSTHSYVDNSRMSYSEEGVPSYRIMPVESSIQMCSRCSCYHSSPPDRCPLYNTHIKLNNSKRKSVVRGLCIPKGFKVSKSETWPGDGVFTSWPLRQFTQLGPVDGAEIQASAEAVKGMDPCYLWPLFGEDTPHSERRLLYTEHCGNWLNLVKYAGELNKYNVQQVLKDGQIYLVTTRKIEQGEELLLRYMEHPTQYYLTHKQTLTRRLSHKHKHSFKCKTCRLRFVSLIALCRHQVLLDGVCVNNKD